MRFTSTITIAWSKRLKAAFRSLRSHRSTRWRAGSSGANSRCWLRGEDFNDEELEHPKSIGHSHVLGPELRTIEGAYAVANKLLHKAAMRLRTARMWTAYITLTIRFAVEKHDSTGQHSLGIPKQDWNESARLVECQDTQTLIEGLQKLWNARPKGARYEKPFFVGVTLTELVPDELHTLSLFPEMNRDGSRRRVAMTMDAL